MRPRTRWSSADGGKARGEIEGRSRERRFRRVYEDEKAAVAMTAGVAWYIGIGNEKTSEVMRQRAL